AFYDEGTLAFTDETIQQLKAHVRPPDLVGDLDETGHFIENPATGWLKLWIPKEQVKNGFPPPAVYFQAVDFAHGDNPNDQKSDQSAITAWRCPRREQILEVCVREKTNRFAEKAWRVWLFLSGGSTKRAPYLCPEAADAGRHWTHEMDDNPDATDRLYYS